MEAFAAVGAASSIIQLVGFAIKILTVGRELHFSVDGSLIENQNIENMHGKLRAALETVDSLTKPNPASSSSTWSEPLDANVKQLSLDARTDCEDILTFLAELKAKQGGHQHFRATLAAFKSIIGRKRIKEMEDRLRRGQGAICLYLTTALYSEPQRIRTAVNRLTENSQRYGIDTCSEIAQLSKGFAELAIKSDEIKAQALPFDSQIERVRIARAC